MFTVRCTQKLLRRVECTDEPSPPTTVLGDWYANVLYSRPHQLVLCVSERSLLPVVLHAKAAHSLASRLTLTVGQVLLRLGIAPAMVEREQREMLSFAYSPTQNRRVLGQLNDLMFQLSWYLHDDPAKDLLAQSLRLAETPCGAIDGFPDKLTIEIFQGVAASAEAYH